jgi:DNA repair ATPase RecN
MSKQCPTCGADITIPPVHDYEACLHSQLTASQAREAKLQKEHDIAQAWVEKLNGQAEVNVQTIEKLAANNAALQQRVDELEERISRAVEQLDGKFQVPNWPSLIVKILSPSPTEQP